jgi:hypothetical protein
VPWSGPKHDGHICSLGYTIVDWLTEYTCHGPGDVQGEPLNFADDPEVEDFIIRCYELDPETGRRKKSKAVYSAPKGRAKSETAGLLGVAEALAEVRFDGWDADGQPVGRPVRSPFIRCLATEENQAGNTFQNIAYVMSEWGPDIHPDIYGGITGAKQYQSATALYLPDGGECRSSSSGAASKDGGKETFLVPDEIHLYVLRELRDMYATSMRNLGKRFRADPWALMTTTACRLGEQSVWETIEKQWRRGELGDEWLVHHREAKGKIDVDDAERTLRQLSYVYGAAMDPQTGWMDPKRVYADMLDPTVCPDEQTAVRYFLNRSMAGSDAWIAKTIHERQTKRDVVDPGEAITLGFDGSLNDDTTVLRGCRMSDGFLFKIGAWAKPDGAAGAGWEVPRLEVLATIREAHERYTVARGYYDLHEWRSDVEALAQGVKDERGNVVHAALGEDVVVGFPTNSYVRTGIALDRLHSGLRKGEVWHDDDPLAAEHYGNAYVDMRGRSRLVRKEYPNSPRKIDSVIGDALALEARADAIADGWSAEPAQTYFRLPR